MVLSIVLVYSLLALFQVKVSESQTCCCYCGEKTDNYCNTYQFEFESYCRCCLSRQNISGSSSCYCSVNDGSHYNSKCMCNENITNRMLTCNFTCTPSKLSSSQTKDVSTLQSMPVSIIMINSTSSKLISTSEIVAQHIVSSSMMIPIPSPSDEQNRTYSELVPTSQMVVQNSDSSSIIIPIPSESPSDEQDGNGSMLLTLLAGSIGATVLFLLAIGIIVLQLMIIYRVRKNRVEVIETIVQTRNEESEMCLWSSGVRSTEPLSVVSVAHETEHTYEELDEFNDRSHPEDITATDCNAKCTTRIKPPKNMPTSHVSHCNLSTCASDYCIPQDNILNRALQTSVSLEIKNTCESCFQEPDCTQYAGVNGEHDYAILESNGVATEVTGEGAAVVESSSEDSDTNNENPSALQPVIRGEQIDIQVLKKTDEFANHGDCCSDTEVHGTENI